MRLSSFVLILILFMASCGLNKVTPVDDTGTRNRRNADSPVLSGIESSGGANEDSFIRNIDENDGKAVGLLIIAPEKIKPKIIEYDTLQAFAVQLKAFGEESSARDVVKQLRQEETDSVFYYKEGFLYKVRVGPYYTRAEAEQKRNSYKNGSFPGAWVAPHLIISSQEVGINEAGKKENQQAIEVSSVSTDNGSLYIQIASTGERKNAEEFLVRNRSVSGFQTTIIQKNDQFKIVVGPFKNREEAQKALTEVRTGFSDAWIINK